MTRANLLREMASLAEAGVPLAQGMIQLATQLPQPWKSRALAWSDHLSQGHTLSQAMAVIPPGLSAGDLALLESAEMCGRLGPTLHELAHASETAARRRSKLTTALLYPVLLFHGVAIIPAFLTYTQSGVQAAVGQIAWILLPGYTLAAAFLLLIRLRGKSGPPHPLLVILDAIPWIGRGLRLAATARFCSILAGMLESGVRVENALERAAAASGDARIRHHLGRLASRVRDQGDPPTTLLQEAGCFDETTLTILSGGEATGSLPTALRRAADKAEFTANQLLDRAALLGPILCYLAAALVAVLQILRLLTPLFTTLDTLLNS